MRWPAFGPPLRPPCPRVSICSPSIVYLATGQPVRCQLAITQALDKSSIGKKRTCNDLPRRARPRVNVRFWRHTFALPFPLRLHGSAYRYLATARFLGGYSSSTRSAMLHRNPLASASNVDSLRSFTLPFSKLLTACAPPLTLPRCATSAWLKLPRYNRSLSTFSIT
jgi:hypothetical protein